MAKSKKEDETKIETSKNKKEEPKPTMNFDLQTEIKKINPYMREGFHRFLLDKEVNNINDFKKYYKQYAGDEL